jgi:hypothetical protein
MKIIGVSEKKAARRWTNNEGAKLTVFRRAAGGAMWSSRDGCASCKHFFVIGFDIAGYWSLARMMVCFLEMK